LSFSLPVTWPKDLIYVHKERELENVERLFLPDAT
jgi:hypothetical protein